MYPSGATWLLRATKVWSLLTNDIWNHKVRKRLRSHLFPRRLGEENQVGFLISTTIYSSVQTVLFLALHRCHHLNKVFQGVVRKSP